jgi:hypothetical protein
MISNIYYDIRFQDNVLNAASVSRFVITVYWTEKYEFSTHVERVWWSQNLRIPFNKAM